MNYYILETDYGPYQIQARLGKLKADKRTKEGKQKKKVFDAITQIAQVAYELDCDISELLPYDERG